MNAAKIIRKVLGRPDQMTTYKDRHRIASAMSLFPVPLSRILRLFGSDKQQEGAHSYGSLYAGIFGSQRYRCLKILEIGVLSGASLLAWRAFFPRAVTIGFDLEDKSKFAVGRRTKCYQGDQGNAADLERVSREEGPFNIIVDDGSHLSKHQIFSFLHLFDHLQPGGLYVIEDVQTSFWSGRVNGFDWDGYSIDKPEFVNTCVGWFMELAKYVNHAEFRTLDGTDPVRLSLGQQIAEVTFAHNVIAIRKADRGHP